MTLMVQNSRANHTRTLGIKHKAIVPAKKMADMRRASTRMGPNNSSMASLACKSRHATPICCQGEQARRERKKERKKESVGGKGVRLERVLLFVG